MTGPKGNSEFCFPAALNVPRGEAEGNIEGQLKTRKQLRKNDLLNTTVAVPAVRAAVKPSFPTETTR